MGKKEVDEILDELRIAYRDRYRTAQQEKDRGGRVSAVLVRGS